MKDTGIRVVTRINSSLAGNCKGLFLLGQGPVEQSSTNKPLAMRVVEDALAYSKKPPVI